jgi:phosphonate transport system substrate-binding protein
LKTLKNKKALSFFLLTIFVATMFLSGCGTKEPATKDEIKVLRVGAVPGEEVQKRKDQYQPFMDYLSKKLDMEVELFVANDYAGTIEAMRAGKLELAGYGPLSYVLAADIANAEAFAAGYTEEQGIYYKSFIIVHKDSDIHSISDLKGKTFAFVDPASTGGHLIPRMAMLKNGIDPEVDLASVVYVGGHDACAAAVQNKNVDAAAIVKHMYERAIAQGILVEEDVRIIDVSDPFPGGPWAWHKDLPQDLKDKIKDAITNIPEEEYENLKDFLGKTTHYEPVQDSDWDSIREAAELINLDLTKSI